MTVATRVDHWLENANRRNQIKVEEDNRQRYSALRRESPWISCFRVAVIFTTILLHWWLVASLMTVAILIHMALQWTVTHRS